MLVTHDQPDRRTAPLTLQNIANKRLAQSKRIAARVEEEESLFLYEIFYNPLDMWRDIVDYE